MDRRGYVDAIVKMNAGIRLYIDIKSSQASVDEHRGANDFAIPFVVSRQDTDEQIFARLIATIIGEYERVKNGAAALAAATPSRYIATV